MKRKLLSLILTLMLCIGFAVPASAAPVADITFMTEAVYDSRGNFSEGLIWMSRGTTISFFDANGNVVISDALAQLRAFLGHEPDMDYVAIGDFHEGLARVLYYNDEYYSTVEYGAFIDKTGKTVFNIMGGVFYIVGDCVNGCVFAREYDSDYITVFDKSGNAAKKLVPPSKGMLTGTSWMTFSDSMLAYHVVDNDWNMQEGYLDLNFNVVIPAKYDVAYPFNDGLAFVAVNGKFGLIDKTGNYVVQPQFDDIVIVDYFTYKVFEDGLACVSKNGKYGFIDTKGNIVIPFVFSTDDNAVREGYVIDYCTNSIVDTGGNVVLDLSGDDDVNMFINGVSLVGKNGVYRLIDIKGNAVSPATWQIDWTRMSYSMANAGVFIYGRGDKLGLAKLTFTETAYTANPTSSKVLVNGESVSFDAYNINDNNYFKLRDLAYVLSGSETQFEVTWDGASDAIGLISGQPYTSVGGEMQGKGTDAKTATTTTAKIYLDDKEISLTAYNIDGNNYFKLRDIGAAFDFEVDWDGENNTIVIDTSRGYTPD